MYLQLFYLCGHGFAGRAQVTVAGIAVADEANRRSGSSVQHAAGAAAWVQPPGLSPALQGDAAALLHLVCTRGDVGLVAESAGYSQVGTHARSCGVDVAARARSQV